MRRLAGVFTSMDRMNWMKKGWGAMRGKGRGRVG
jgi:hypothetical protein